MACASWLAFGADTWHTFVGNIGHTSQAFLSEGAADFRKLQTVFGLTRTLGGSEPLAWSLQALVTSPRPQQSRRFGGAVFGMKSRQPRSAPD